MIFNMRSLYICVKDMKRAVDFYERKRHNNLFSESSNIPTNNHHIVDAYKIKKST